MPTDMNSEMRARAHGILRNERAGWTDGLISLSAILPAAEAASPQRPLTDKLPYLCLDSARIVGIAFPDAAKGIDIDAGKRRKRHGTIYTA